MKGHLQDIITNLETGHDKKWWTTPRRMAGGRMVSPIDFVADDLNGYLFDEYPELGRWQQGIARIAVGELQIGLSVKHIKELRLFKKMLRLILADRSNSYNANLNGETFSSLYSRYGNELIEEDQALRQKVSSLQLTPNHYYSIKKIRDFNDMHPYGIFTPSCSPWCVADSERKYDAFAANGENSIYVVLHKDYQNISKPGAYGYCLPYLQQIGKEAHPPYDDYGLSMILLVVAQDGSLIYCTSRWNHSFSHAAHDFLDEWRISLLIGKNFYETFNYSQT